MDWTNSYDPRTCAEPKEELVKDFLTEELVNAECCVIDIYQDPRAYILVDRTDRNKSVQEIEKYIRIEGADWSESEKENLRQELINQL